MSPAALDRLQTTPSRVLIQPITAWGSKARLKLQTVHLSENRWDVEVTSPVTLCFVSFVYTLVSWISNNGFKGFKSYPKFTAQISNDVCVH